MMETSPPDSGMRDERALPVSLRRKQQALPSQRIKLDADLMGGFLDAFLLNTLDTPVQSPPFHKEAWRLVTSDHPQVGLAAPRGHAKSTAITLAYVLAMLLFRNVQYAAVVSNTKKKAVEFVRNLKDALLNNEAIRSHFKVRDFSEKDTEDDFICTLESGYQFRVSSISFGGVVRGLNWGTKRPQLIMCDDMEDDEQVLSSDRREAAMTWFLSALLPSMPPDGIVRVVGTVLHVDSVLQNLINDDENWLTRVWEAHDDNFENILWPERYTREILLRIRRGYIRQGRLENYNMEYRNRAVDTSSGFFQDSEFRPMTDEMKMPEARAKRHFYAGGDLAYSQKQKRDYSAFPVVSIDGEGNWYVEHVSKGRYDGRQNIDEIFALDETFQVQCWFIEDGAILRSLMVGVEDEMRERRRDGRNTMPIVEPIGPPIHDKKTRARPFQKLMRSKRVYWDTEASWFPDVRQELLEFDRGLHDDVVDSFATLAMGLGSMSAPYTEEEEEEENYVFKKKQTQNNGGRNRTTGY